jgi:hypothetical protein
MQGFVLGLQSWESLVPPKFHGEWLRPGRHVRYEGDKLLDHVDDGVMMEWETPLMKAHAEILCGQNRERDVLNVGVKRC